MKYLLLSCICFFSLQLLAQDKVELSYYFPNENFDKSITTPEEGIGFTPGEWHVSHDRLVSYMYLLAEESSRVSLIPYAKSHEGRQLLTLAISSVENQKNLDNLKQKHLDFVSGKTKSLSDEIPTVLYQGYSVHGNESSGANAAVLYAYYLATAQGAEIDKLLSNQIILLDPVFNPDGLHRFSTWVNMHKSKFPSSDEVDREFNEPWPRGRTNHYWFDLNRDWLLLVHPESRGRIAMFHDWKPNILTDHHEMGSNSTFFFQPGIATRTNPMTPPENQTLTAKVGTYHAAELDKIGSQYYSQESFDDFYYGKGSTYPDVNGCIGILFEQASSRGHSRQTKNGLLTFPFTIRNQLKTSISTLKAGHELRAELLDFQQRFYGEAKKLAGQDSQKAFAVGSKNDKEKLMQFAEILMQHQIEVEIPKNGIQINGSQYSKDQSIVVSTNQEQYRLIKGIFETQTSFTDSLFYDVSAWNLAMAFGLDYQALTSKVSGGTTSLVSGAVDKLKNRTVPKSDYGYLIDWRNYAGPKVLHKIQKNDLRVKVAAELFSAQVEGTTKEFPAGTLFVPLQNQSKNEQAIFELMTRLSKDGVEIYDVDSGLTPKGIDLGSNNFPTLSKAKVLMLVGNGISGYDAGEIWHLFDTKFEMPITKVESNNFSGVKLEDYTVLIIPDGNPSRLNTSQKERIKKWVQSGGTIIGLQKAVSWMVNNNLSFAKTKSKESTSNNASSRPYIKSRADRGAQGIGGAIFNNDLDLTHPLCFGFELDQLPVFHQGTNFFQSPKSPYAAPVRYTRNPLLAGYISKQNLVQISNSSAVVCSSIGRGKSLAFSFNPVFRGYWRGTERLLANAIFFGSIIRRDTCESSEED